MNDKKMIILAEDEENLGSTLTFVLKKHGYDVRYFTNGFSAYMKIKELVESGQTPDLLITDLQMPGLKGTELIDYIGSLAFHLPVLVITGYGDKNTVVDLLRKGCSDYIDKPFDDKTFINSVNNIFKKEEERNLEMVDIKIKLLKELEQYKKENTELQLQINAAIDSYQNLIEINEIPDELPLAYKILPYCNLGGDFFDIRKTRQGFDVILADVAGHDISACFNTVVIKGSFYEHRETDGLGDVYFNMLNKQLVKNFPEARMVTAVFIAFNLKEMYADFVIAGHPYPFIVEKNKIIQPRTGNPVLGFLDNVKYMRERIHVTPGMRILLYTDGIINAQKYGENGISHLGKQGLSRSITHYTHEVLLNMVEDIWADTLVFCDQKPCDDMLLLGIEVPKNGKVYYYPENRERGGQTHV
jgi:FixJ family two-component response regulator